MIKHIFIYNRRFAVQSYLKDEYCYLVSVDDDFPSIRVEFWQKNKDYIFSSNQKTNIDWFKFVENIDLTSLKNQLNELFDYC